MILKEFVVLLLLSVTFASASQEKYDESADLLQGQDHHVKEKKHFSNDDDDWGEKKHENSKIDAAKQFEKDYNRWSDKKFKKHNTEEFKDYMTVNEIESNEYVDKYNKYGKTFNPNLVNFKKSKENYHEEGDSQRKEHHKKRIKPKSLLHDTDVNYINNIKMVSGDSELINTNSMLRTKENYQENYQNGNEMHMKRYKKDFLQNIRKLNFTDPPVNDSILMARYIVHTVDWAALGTISGRSPTKGAPFVCLKATTDGINNFATGVPYFYMSPLDICTQDLEKDNRVSVLMALSETQYCSKVNYDPQDPRCAKVTLSGKIKRVKPGSEEEKFAKNALFTKHPAMATWPADHNWYFTKLKIGQIILLDNFGGATYIKVKDYLNGGPTEPQL